MNYCQDTRQRKTFWTVLKRGMNLGSIIMNRRAKVNRNSGRDVMNLYPQGKGRKISWEENGNSISG